MHTCIHTSSWWWCRKKVGRIEDLREEGLNDDDDDDDDNGLCNVSDLVASYVCMYVCMYVYAIQLPLLHSLLYTPTYMHHLPTWDLGTSPPSTYLPTYIPTYIHASPFLHEISEHHLGLPTYIHTYIHTYIIIYMRSRMVSLARRTAAAKTFQ